MKFTSTIERLIFTEVISFLGVIVMYAFVLFFFSKDIFWAAWFAIIPFILIGIINKLGNDPLFKTILITITFAIFTFFTFIVVNSVYLITIIIFDGFLAYWFITSIINKASELKVKKITLIGSTITEMCLIWLGFWLISKIPV
ncbi:MAG: hypothetical protein WC697_02805 [Patescibacteria group bacterium]|jgi:hypothetical protein